MKKFIAMMLCIILTLSLVACGNNTEETTETTTAATEETTTAATEETTEETTEELTEELTEEEIYDENGLDADTLALLENPTFNFVELGADGIQFEPVDPSDDMLMLKDLHMALPVEQRFAEFNVTTVLPENYEYEMYFPYAEGFNAVSCNAANMTQAHFVYLIHAPEGTDIEALCAQIEANADPRRNICSLAEAILTAHSGNTILFVMSQNPASAASLIDGFNAMMAG